MRVIEKVWFEGHSAKWLLVPLLLPMTLLFWLLASLRRTAYKLGLIKSVDVGIPVIIVGNIGIGGNGKTPIVMYLVELCIQQGLKPGVISRGYGGKLPQDKKYPLTLDQYTPVEECGDEPFLIYHRVHVPVVVGPDRVASVASLKEQGCNIIIADDGLQHYRLKRSCEIIVVDGKRGFGNGLLLPAGPLREGQWRLPTVQQVIINGNNSVNVPPPYASMTLIPEHIINIQTGERVDVKKFVERFRTINAIAGIGDPQRFFNTLNQSQFCIEKQKAFVDHHHYLAADFAGMEASIPLLMTEKDAVKCKKIAQNNWWYLSVSAQFTAKETQMLVELIQKAVSH
jgi:tetraacyldisaccharide 4'-kinase